MKSKAKRGAGYAPLIISALALLLAVAAVWTAPLAVSKYASMGWGRASVQVAGWNPELIGHPHSGKAFPVELILRNKSGENIGIKHFTIRNNGDVTADFTIVMEYVDVAPNDPAFLTTKMWQTFDPTSLTMQMQIRNYTPNPQGGATANDLSDLSWRLPPGASVDFEIEFQYYQSMNTFSKVHTYRIYGSAVQVD